MQDKNFLNKAIELSQQSVDSGGFPVGAIVVIDGEVAGNGISNGKKTTRRY